MIPKGQIVVGAIGPALIDDEFTGQPFLARSAREILHDYPVGKSACNADLVTSVLLRKYLLHYACSASFELQVFPNEARLMMMLVPQALKSWSKERRCRFRSARSAVGALQN